MDERTLRALEFPDILTQLSRFCLSEAGGRAALALCPLDDAARVSHALHLFEETRSWLAEGEFRLPGFPDISGVFGFLQGRDPVLDSDALWAMRETLTLSRQAAESVHAGAARRPLLDALALASPPPEQSLSALRRCVADDGGLKDESSPGLLLVRSEMRGLHQGCLRRVREYAEKYNIGHYLQDDYMTLASDRYVLPLKANFKGRLQGIIHDYSHTGETLYFEPLFLVEQNNRLQELKQAEREEERKVYRMLTGLLLQELPRVEAAWNFLVQLDLNQAKVALADALDGRAVSLEPGATLSLREARHPLLALEAAANRAQGSAASPKRLTRVEPVDLLLREGDHVLVISGGNAGGKTVALKTLGLVTLMTLAGLPAPVGPGSRLPRWNRVHAFIGDEQSLEDHVSTFTGQIEHLASIWDSLDEDALLLLDEFGAGTDPAQGAALAQAVIDGVLDKRACAVTATHFPALKTYALTRQGVRAASVLFDPATKKALYRLAYDQVGASQALDVAREHGLPESVLRRAEHYLLMDGQDTNAIMDRLNELAGQRESELERLRQEEIRTRDKRRQLQERYEKDLARLHDELRGQSRELMAAWKSGKATARQAMKEMARLRAELAAQCRDDAEQAAAPPDIVWRAGDRVRHKPWNKQAVICDVDERGGRAKLDMGGVTLWAAFSALEPLGDAGGSAAAPGAALTTRISGPFSFLRLDLRGKRADLALAELEQFLDRALLAGPDGVEILHGRGTGALRKAVHQFLKSFPGVASFEVAPEDQGGDGVTLVTFR
ncbi:MAG: Smr/MutS family protein [Desulfovibrionaceae bacterium]|nr:Smr/MutS family protein [Desulfovibrionaceae bacterium]